MNFAEWLKLTEVGNEIIPGTPAQDRRPDLVKGGLGDKMPYNNPMRSKDNTTSAFPTYDDPLPGNKRRMKK